MNLIIRQLIGWFANVLEGLILVRCVLSWFPSKRDNVIISLIYTLTEPILEPIRNLLQKSPLGGPGMMLDFSPVIAIILVQLVSGLLLQFFRA